MDISKKGVISEGRKVWVPSERNIVYNNVDRRHPHSLHLYHEHTKLNEMKILQGVTIKVYLPMDLWSVKTKSR